MYNIVQVPQIVLNKSEVCIGMQKRDSMFINGNKYTVPFYPFYLSFYLLYYVCALELAGYFGGGDVEERGAAMRAVKTVLGALQVFDKTKRFLRFDVIVGFYRLLARHRRHGAALKVFRSLFRLAQYFREIAEEFAQSLRSEIEQRRRQGVGFG